MTMPQSTKAKNQRVINCWIDFSNTDAAIIEKASDIVSRMGIGFHIAEKRCRPIYKADGGTFLPRKEICLALRIGKLTSTRKLLIQLIPYLAGSKAAASRLIVKFCDQRIEKGRRAYDTDDLMVIREYYESRGGKAAERNIAYIDGSLNDYTTGANQMAMI
jgi:hypothetical protein